MYLRKAALRHILFGLSLAAAPWVASAADDPQASHTVSEVTVIAHRPPTVEELTVVAQAKCLQPKFDHNDDRPRLVSTYPREGQVVRPGLLIVRLTFDKPMSCAGFLGLRSGRTNPCSATEQHFLMTFDHKTIRIACVAEPGAHYGFQLNGAIESLDGGAVPFRKFVSLSALPVDQSYLDFAVSTEPPIVTILDALTADPETVLPDVYRPPQQAAHQTPDKTPAH